MKSKLMGAALAALILAGLPAAAAALPTISVGVQAGYQAHVDSDVDDYNGLMYGAVVGYQVRRNMAFGFGLDRISVDKNDFTLTQTRLYGHIEYHAKSPGKTHLYSGIGPALTYVEAEPDDSTVGVEGENKWTVGLDLKGGVWVTLSPNLALTAEARITVLYVDFPGNEFDNLSQLAGTVGLRYVMEQ